MPYKSEKIKLSPEQDRRRKLTEEQKQGIRTIYNTGYVGMRPLAKQFKVSRATIQIIVNPKREQAVKQHIKDHWKDYQNREQLTEATRKLRKYKQELYLKGELKEKE